MESVFFAGKDAQNTLFLLLLHRIYVKKKWQKRIIARKRR